MPATKAIPEPTLASVLAELKSKGSEQTRKIYARHGNAPDHLYGVSVADMKLIAKTMRGRQSLACQLYETGKLEAMYLAGMVADGAQMTSAQLNQWVEIAEAHQMVSEYTIPWLTVENPQGRKLALSWIKSKKEHIAAAGWSTYIGLLATRPDEDLDFGEIEQLLQTIEKNIKSAPNRVRSTMNIFVISVGSYVKPLLKQARQTAVRIGEVTVDVGETACKVPSAVESIKKAEDRGTLGKKRKTIRC